MSNRPNSIGHIISHLKFTRNRKFNWIICNILLHLKVYITFPLLDFSIHWTRLLWDLLALLCHPHYTYTVAWSIQTYVTSENYTLHILYIILTERIESQLFTGDSTTTHDHVAVWCNSPDERCLAISPKPLTATVYTYTTRSRHAWHLTGNLTVLDTLTSEPLTLWRRGAEWLIVHPNLEQQQ